MKLSAEEREQLDTMIQVGKHAARKLLKADASEAGVATVARTRQSGSSSGNFLADFFAAFPLADDARAT